MWAILIVVQVLDVDYMAYGSGSVYQRCAEQILQVSTMMTIFILMHTYVIISFFGLFRSAVINFA